MTLRNSAPTQLARIAERASRFLQRTRRRLLRLDQRVVSLPAAPAAPERGRALFSFILDPILEAARHGAASDDLTHTHFWESLRMVEILRQAGWSVDAVSWTNSTFAPEHSYDLVIDVRTQLERWRPSLPSTTRCIAHLDTAHWKFNNAAELRRLAGVADRRGARLRARRQIPENQLIESADLASCLGNRFTASTYEFANVPLHHVPVSVPREYPWPGDRDVAAARHRFLWFGSGGLVHKGLDLVLETFAGLPQCELFVCGPIARERDFEREYRHELYDLPHIHTLGWVDISSRPFRELTSSCLALVYPSCSEGGGSSALTCMHAGLIPLLTREASIDLHPQRSVELRDLEITALREVISDFAAQPTHELEERARGAWAWVRQHHSRTVFSERYRRFVDAL